MPLDMGVAEFCSFVGAYLPKLREMRVVRREDGKSVCLILLRFESLEIADSFFCDYHDKPVSLEPGHPPVDHPAPVNEDSIVSSQHRHLLKRVVS